MKMKYDLDSYLSRKRITLEEFAKSNNLKTVNDLGMFILNNKTFDISDTFVEKMTALLVANEPKELPVEELEIISPASEPEEDQTVKPVKKSSKKQVV
jgi:hypothetical protein